MVSKQGHFTKGKFSSWAITITSGKDKLRAVEAVLGKLGVELGKCIVMGDDIELDGPLLEGALCPVASPLAKQPVINISQMALSEHRRCP